MSSYVVLSTIRWCLDLRKVYKRVSLIYGVQDSDSVKGGSIRDELFEGSKEVLSELGSGYTESVYHRALERELSERNIPFHSEGTIPVMYKGAPVGRRRPDMFIVTDNGTIVVELKAGSSGGMEQLEQYLEMTTDDENLGRIIGGALIQFNEDDLGFHFSPNASLKFDNS